MEAWREELYHHGIEGQKWGVQNGPPYPLDQSDKSAAEKQAERSNGDKNSYNGSHSVNSLSNISDRELQDYVNRLNMERQYADLTREKDANLETVRKVNTWLKELAGIADSVSKLYNFKNIVGDAFSKMFGKKKNNAASEARALDNGDLRDAVERLELEQRYIRAKG